MISSHKITKFFKQTAIFFVAIFVVLFSIPDLTNAQIITPGSARCNINVSVNNSTINITWSGHGDWDDSYVQTDAEISIDGFGTVAQSSGDLSVNGAKNITSFPNGLWTARISLSAANGSGCDDSKDFVVNGDVGPQNTAPTITLLGSSSVTISQGQSYSDAGATAQDAEDGDLTANIIRTGSVDVNTPGVYELYFNVSDSGSLSASQLIRTITVASTPPPTDCSSSNIYNNISGSIVSTGSPATGRIVNHSSCTYTVSIASYKMFSSGADWISTQTLFDSKTVTIHPFETIDVDVLSVSVPGCRYQIDLIEGNPIVPPDYGGLNHALFAADYGGGALCTNTVPPTATILINGTHTPSPISYNSAVTVSWNSTDATSCDIYQGDALNDGPIVWSATSGSHSVNLTSYTRFRIRCVGAGGTAFDQASVDVIPLPTVTIVANPTSVNYGGSSTLTWSSTNATACSATGDWSGSKAISGSELQTNLTVNKTYTITCTGPGGTATATALVGVGVQPPTVTIAASPQSIPYGSISTLIWSSTNATACSATGDWSGSKAISGSEVQGAVGGLTTNKTYTITCTGPGGTASAVATVTVGPQNHPPVITRTGPSPVTIVQGQTYTDLGATALDQEDGDITVHIVTLNPVNTNVLGTYTVTYNVQDSQGLAAAEVTRVVDVVHGCPPVPVITSALNATTTKGQSFSYTLTFSVSGIPVTTSVSGLPTGLSFSTTTNIISGTPAVAGVFSIDLFAGTLCGGDAKTLTLNVVEPSNHPPVITRIGPSPVTVVQGQTYTDLGATALDQEDGDITVHIVTLNPVNTNVLGTYTVTYNVQDSQGLAATQVSRTVNVVPPVVPTGTIRFCIMLADASNVVATSSAGLPFGVFGIDLATTTGFGGSIVQSKTWNTTPSGFSPNTKIISAVNDSDCITYTVPLGTYYYSQLNVTGSHWVAAKYNDQNNHPVNNVFDFFNYSPELFNATSTDDAGRNLNSDGQIVLSVGNANQTLVMFEADDAGLMCLAPQITSPLTATGTVGTPFTYTLTATSSTAATFLVSGLPSGLSFSTTTNIISGTPTTAGTFNVSLTVGNLCAGGIDVKTLVLTINPTGGGGSSANIGVTKTVNVTSTNTAGALTYTITVTNFGPDTATGVTATDVLPNTVNFISATSTLGSYVYSTGIWTVGTLANGSSATLTLVATVKSGTEGQTITNTVTAASNVTDPNTGNNTASVNVSVNTPTSGGGGGGGGGGGDNGPISGTIVNTPTLIVPQAPAGCYYLYDYLRKDFNNNPVEVRKLQVFLRDLEGFSSVKITGVYDDQTIAALDAFQNRYAGDILTPWGHNAPTSYTYILTKKKVNEIYCRRAFPVTQLQQEEIDSYRTFLASLQSAGIILGNPSIQQSTTTTVFPDNTVGISTSTNATLAGVSSTTTSVLSRFSANVIYAGGKIVDFILWPFKWLFRGLSVNQCSLGFSFSRLFNWILFILVCLISYLWYRQYTNNKKIEDINKEIDLVK